MSVLQSMSWLTEGETWLSTAYVLLVVPLYLGVLWALKRLIRWRGKPYDLKLAVILHNSILSIGSAVLFVALTSELLRMVNRGGFGSVFCDSVGQWTHGRQHFLYYLNYLFKFVELLDTCLLALRGKPTPFLHVYHHAATLVLCWTQLVSKTCMQWVVIDINLFVHVIMYLYYALHALGIEVWWKQYLTLTQIVQFVISLAACFVAMGSRIAHWLGFNSPRCHGTWFGAWFGIVILLSYLILFLQLWFQMYGRKPTGKHTTVNAKAIHHS